MKKNTPKKNPIVTHLNHVLADSMILYVKTLNYHWNMVGDVFFMYHRLLEEQYKEQADAIDEIAERIRMLGYNPPSTLREFLELTCLKEGRSNLSQEKMVAELVYDHEQMVGHLTTLIDTCDESGDPGSSDLLVDRLRVHDKNAWLLRSHLKK